jgi:hypothetical protein
MLRDKITKILRLPSGAAKQHNRNLTVSIEPQSHLHLTHIRRFSADSKDNTEATKAQVEENSKPIPVSQERDKVFSEKKMSIWDQIKVGLHHIKDGFVKVGVEYGIPDEIAEEKPT